MGLLDRFLDVELAPYLTPQTLFAFESTMALASNAPPKIMMNYEL